jgi:hypothetical protein
LGTLVARTTDTAGEAPSAADALGGIMAALPC